MLPWCVAGVQCTPFNQGITIENPQLTKDASIIHLDFNGISWKMLRNEQDNLLIKLIKS